MPGFLRVWRFAKAGGCRWCACGQGLLVVLSLRRRCPPRGALGCLALIIGLLAFGWLVLLLRRVRKRPRGPEPGPLTAGALGRPATGERQTIPGTIYRRPDPMIYDQYYLQSQGLAVTWDNPDIHLERPRGTKVPSHDLLPNTEYRVVARIWNLSERAAAVQLPVEVSYLSFGIGTKKEAFAQTVVNELPVKGSPGLPARAEVTWTTPPDPGHYCLQVELLWPKQEDENPDNNLGQHNTDIRAVQSPATFRFPVRNDDLLRGRAVRLAADAYRIPPLPPCDSEEAAGVERHAPSLFAVPEGWRVGIEPASLELAPDQEVEVSVTVTAPDGFGGRQPINVNAFDGERLLGGVTLYVDGGS